MGPLSFVIVATVILGLYWLLRAARKSAASRQKKVIGHSGTAGQRQAIRRKLVMEADSLHAMEEAAMRFGEGTDPGMDGGEPRERAEQLRAQAALMRTRLEAECLRLGLPIGLVRRNRGPKLAADRPADR